MPNLIPAHLLPNVPMKRIHAHWSAGGYIPNLEYDRKAYHFLFGRRDNKPIFVPGIPTIDKNSGRIKDGYSAHTLNANTDAISVSCASMAGATEVPFNPGNFAMMEDQFDLMCRGMAECCAAYSIPVSDKTTLSHAEVQPNLGIAQRAKWDFTRLPWAPEIRGARACGEYMREKINMFLNRVDKVDLIEIEEDNIMDNNPIPEGALVEIVAAVANFRRTPGGALISALPRGVQLRVIGRDGNWIECRTPMGHEGWLSKELLKAIDGPAVEEPTTPDTSRLLIANMRKVIDEHEASLK